MESAAISVYTQPNKPLTKIGDIRWPFLKEEKWRLATFAKYPRNAPKSAALLAANGFAYIGSGKGHDDKVICCFCCHTKEGWCLEDDILEVHTILCGECPMVTDNACDNVRFCENPHRETSFTIISRKQQNQRGQSMTDNTLEMADLSSAASADSPTTQYSRALQTTLQTSTSSFSSQPLLAPKTSTTLRSNMTSGTVSNGSASSLSANSQTTTTAMPNMNQTNTVSSGTSQASHISSRTSNLSSYNDLCIITGKPKIPKYAAMAQRLETFGSWPIDHRLKKEGLAKAGFYYFGNRDRVRCFYCGGALKLLDIEDDVRVEHARWLPRCGFIQQTMGQAFVETVTDLTTEQHSTMRISFEMVLDRMRGCVTHYPKYYKEWSQKEDPAIQALVDEGYEKDDVIEVACMLKEGGDTLSADKLLNKIQKGPRHRSGQEAASDPSYSCSKSSLPKEEKSKIDQLKEKNNELRQQTVCKICMDKEVTFVFLPCGHLVSCSDCASAVNDCPVCQVTVEGIVRAYWG